MAPILGGTALALSFALLYQRRVSAAINVCALQAWLLALAAAWQGFALHAAFLDLLALVTAVANGIAIPIALHRIVRQFDINRSLDTWLGVVPRVILGVVLVALSILVVLPMQAPSREDLAVALSIVLTGLLMMIARRNVVAQVVGLLSLANGVILAVIGMAGKTLVIGLPAAFLAMAALIVFGAGLVGRREPAGETQG